MTTGTYERFEFRIGDITLNGGPLTFEDIVAERVAPTLSRGFGGCTVEGEIKLEEAASRAFTRWFNELDRRGRALTPARFVSFVAGRWWWLS